jgi:hypothetical protein
MTRPPPTYRKLFVWVLAGVAAHDSGRGFSRSRGA